MSAEAPGSGPGPQPDPEQAAPPPSPIDEMLGELRGVAGTSQEIRGSVDRVEQAIRDTDATGALNDLITWQRGEATATGNRHGEVMGAHRDAERTAQERHVETVRSLADMGTGLVSLANSIRTQTGTYDDSLTYLTDAVAGLANMLTPLFAARTGGGAPAARGYARYRRATGAGSWGAASAAVPREAYGTAYDKKVPTQLVDAWIERPRNTAGASAFFPNSPAAAQWAATPRKTGERPKLTRADTYVANFANIDNEPPANPDTRYFPRPRDILRDPSRSRVGRVFVALGSLVGRRIIRAARNNT